MDVKEQRDWLVKPLFNELVDALRKDEAERNQGLTQTLKSAISDQEEDPDAFRKVTIQADKEIDFLTIKIKRDASPISI